MYITNQGHTGYNDDGQYHTSAPFLILMSDETKPFDKTKIRAIVRKVALKQLGHYMMGIVSIAGHSISVSGAYGNDGLTKDVPHEVYEKGIPVPTELIEAWDTGGGWNSAGSEADAMRKWAKENLL